MPQVTGPLVRYPARVSFFWYLLLIAVGTFVLALPACSAPAARISPLNALFTATSAACVTGLTVRSTANDFSLIGQVVILLLIQLGGIGIMTVTTFVTFRLGGRAGLRQRAVVAETLGAAASDDLFWVLQSVLRTTMAIELAGALLLFGWNWMHYGMPPLEAAWHALFHAISAFCNAGFALDDGSLIEYQADPVVNLVICALIILGGIGFPVLFDFWRHWDGRWHIRWDRLHVHSKSMVIGTAALLILGTVLFLVLELDGVLRGMPWGKKLLVSFFQSTTCRTAGFNTVDLAQLTGATLFIMIVLMAIGGGPCSTAGGIKVSTLMVLVFRAWSTFRGFARVNVFRRTIPGDLIERAVATALLFGVVGIVALTGVLVFEEAHLLATSDVSPHGLFLETLFEVVSALGTVGLTLGLTTRLGDVGQWTLILLMLMGRLGPISVFIALSRTERAFRIEFPPEEPLIG